MNFFDVIQKDTWTQINQTVSDLREHYVHAEPFPHIALDNVFSETFLFDALEHFPMPDKSWWQYDNFMEKKWAMNDMTQMHDSIRAIIQTLHEKEFIQFLEKLTGIESTLIVDTNLNGGGLHQITRGGKLDIHVDYNYHPQTKLDRRLNVILYMNLPWLEEWKGSLEFWNQDMSACKRSIAPIFNRLVVFSTTEQSNHGHPEPLECPENYSRKSIAIYYYTNGRPKEETVAPHSTKFKKRPQDPEDPEQDRLRELRGIKRLT